MMTLIFGGIYYFGLWAAGLRLLYVAVEYPFVYYREKRERLEAERDDKVLKEDLPRLLKECEELSKRLGID